MTDVRFLTLTGNNSESANVLAVCSRTLPHVLAVEDCMVSVSVGGGTGSSLSVGGEQIDWW